MELQIDLGINQLINLIRQLPPEQKVLIKKELEKEVSEKEVTISKNELTKLLLSGPVMTEEEESNFRNLNHEFDKWTRNLFV
jgi:hypothetical protein